LAIACALEELRQVGNPFSYEIKVRTINSATFCHQLFCEMRSELLQLLRCPVDRTPLTEASSDLIAQINGAIAAGRAANLGGQRLQRAIDGGLVRAAGDVLYPIADGIPVLLRDEAISLQDEGLELRLGHI
jgi:uncharacterized protein YbaR (Trm112 family)